MVRFPQRSAGAFSRLAAQLSRQLEVFSIRTRQWQRYFQTQPRDGQIPLRDLAHGRRRHRRPNRILANDNCSSIPGVMFGMKENGIKEKSFRRTRRGMRQMWRIVREMCMRDTKSSLLSRMSTRCLSVDDDRSKI